MDLGGLWDATVGKYTRSELWPAYCCAVPVWTLLGPFRDVAIAFALQVWRVVKMNGGMWYESAVMYQDVLRDPKLRQLEGPTYAYALWNALFTIPVHVLGDGRAERVPTSSDLEYAEVDFRVDDMGLVGDRSSGVHRSFLARVAPVRWNSTLHKVTPGVKASCVMDSVSRNAAKRDRAEMASQNRLRAPDVEVLSDFQAEDSEAPPIADVPAGDEIYYYGDGDHTTGMPEDFTVVGEIVPCPSMQMVFQVDGRWTRPQCHPSVLHLSRRRADTVLMVPFGAGTGTLLDTDLIDDRCQRREDGAPTEWCKDG
ncbi:hypothetical protein PI126_g4445 [Phytophthora idaei]|nr:hypothetical protein PI126_g4445 [Phytophthora idaei]